MNVRLIIKFYSVVMQSKKKLCECHTRFFFFFFDFAMIFSKKVGEFQKFYGPPKKQFNVLKFTEKKLQTFFQKLSLNSQFLSVEDHLKAPKKAIIVLFRAQKNESKFHNKSQYYAHILKYRSSIYLGFFDKKISLKRPLRIKIKCGEHNGIMHFTLK